MEDEEKAYLYRLIDAVIYNEDLFTINYGAENSGKVIFGAFFQSGNINKFFMYKTLYDTIVHTNTAIRRSLKTAIPYAYIDTENYDPFFPSKNEQEAAYFIENTVFRTIILWDILAQLYNAKYEIEQDASRIFYKKFFKNNSPRTII